MRRESALCKYTIGRRKSGTICSHAGRQAVFEIGSEGLETTRGEKGASLVVGADRHLRSVSDKEHGYK